uniref:Uncharacterized protein n=1 Tax=Arundo donax TaxID=35708 RepID=A0A0A9C9C1_ARUDO
MYTCSHLHFPLSRVNSNMFHHRENLLNCNHQLVRDFKILLV